MGLVPAAFVGIDNIPQGNIQWPETLPDEEWAQVNVDYRSIMNYNYMFTPLIDRFFLDFSDGSRGEYDFNDLTHFYLPTFQIDAAILESPDIRNVGFEEFEWTDKDPDPLYGGWELDENLTEEFKQELSELRFDIDNAVDYDYRIYIKVDTDQKGRDIRVYTKPNIKPIPALWSLIGEGQLETEENTLNFYSYDLQFEEVLERI